MRFLKVIRVTDRTVPPQCASTTTAHHRLLPQGSYCPSPSFALPHLRASTHTHITSLAHTDEHTHGSVLSHQAFVSCMVPDPLNQCTVYAPPSHQSSVWYEIIYPTMQCVRVTRWAVSCYSILSAAASECVESQNARGHPSNSESTFTGLSMFWPGSTMFCRTSIQLHAYNCTHSIPTSYPNPLWAECELWVRKIPYLLLHTQTCICHIQTYESHLNAIDHVFFFIMIAHFCGQTHSHRPPPTRGCPNNWQHLSNTIRFFLQEEKVDWTSKKRQ